MQVVWSCDPIHDNMMALNTHKTRPLDCVLLECNSFLRIHRAEGVHPSGVDIQMTDEDVTECKDGSRAVIGRNLEE